MPSFFHFLSHKPFETDGVIMLRISKRDETDEECGIVDSYSFDIYECASKQYAGYVSIRIGESAQLYYLGHIGYRIEKPLRGHNYAYRACELLIPFIQKLRIDNLVITTDPTNTASVKTCEHLGCITEQIVPVPQKYQGICSGSVAKRRFIWQIPHHSKTLSLEG